MQNHVLSSHVSFCRIGPSIVLFDVDRDRYRLLTERLIPPFEKLINEQRLTLDELAALQRVDLVGEGPQACPCRTTETRPAKTRFEPAAPANAFRTLAVIWAIMRAQRELRRTSIRSVLTRYHLAKRAYQIDPLRSLDYAGSILSAFENSRRWIASAKLCLPRSLALFAILARGGFEAQLVIGVRLDPFEAHCWVQAGDVVLDDDLEEVVKFTPIHVL